MRTRTEELRDIAEKSFDVCVIGGGATMSVYLGAIDQGTTSTRFIVFDRTGRVVSVAQKGWLPSRIPVPGMEEGNNAFV